MDTWVHDEVWDGGKKQMSRALIPPQPCSSSYYCVDASRWLARRQGGGGDPKKNLPEARDVSRLEPLYMLVLVSFVVPGL